MRKNPLQKRQQNQPEEFGHLISYIETSKLSSNGVDSGSLKNQPKLWISIECRPNVAISDNIDGQQRHNDDRSSSREELVYFDLYKSNGNKFIRHLAKIQFNDSLSKGSNLRDTNKSLLIELGKDLESLTSEEIADQYFIVMSTTAINTDNSKAGHIGHLDSTKDANNTKFNSAPTTPNGNEINNQDQLRSNVTLHFNGEFALARKNQSPSDRFPRTSDFSKFFII